MVEGADLEKLATWGFACLVALMLLRFFLGDLAKKLDCIKDTLIEVAKRVRNIEKKVGE